MLPFLGLHSALHTPNTSGQLFPKCLHWCKQQQSSSMGECSRNNPETCPCPGQTETSTMDTGVQGGVGHSHQTQV